MLVLRGEAGVGKTALLGYLLERASGCRIARAAGVESETELAFAGLHQLFAPFLDRLERLPGPQRHALGTAFSLQGGDAPDRFAVGLAVLSLLSDVAGERPLVCVVDGAQWLDRASAQALGFVARRLAAESVAVVFAVRQPGGEQDLTGLPELVVEGLGDSDARALLDSVVTGPFDERVRDRVVAETRGNPRALLELARGLTPEDLAGGFGLPGARARPGRIEEGFRRRLTPLPPTTRLMLAAWRGREGEARQLIATVTTQMVARGEGQWLTAAHWATAVLNNGLGRYDEALVAAEQGSEYPDELGLATWSMVELIETAARCGSPGRAAGALRRLSEIAGACGTDWALGIEARSRPLLSDGEFAEHLYREAIERLGRTRVRAELARAHLLYGEWLRRQNRRVDAREQLRAAYEMLAAMGAEGFAERARRELLATGETVRKRTAVTADELTPQEAEIARLARDGHTNPEIGVQLFISARTVEWHLRKVFAKLGVSSRKELRRALSAPGRAAVPA